MVKQTANNILKFVATITLSVAVVSSVSAADDTKRSSFNVNVGEVLSVSVTTPTNWATGDVGEFLRNKVSVNVISNNTNGFTASMAMAASNPALVNASKIDYTLPTLTANTTRSNFPANYWGFSLDDTDAGSDTSTYRAMVGSSGTPITLLSSTTATTGTKDFFFGAKANITQASGIYHGVVVISVVSGVIDPGINPVTPVNPVNPNPTPNTPNYNPSSNVTAYTYNRNNTTVTPNTSSTTTEVTSGDNTSVYDGYTPPQGVTYSTTSRIPDNSFLATSLAIASSIAATSGAFFLFAARREEDEDDEDGENMI